MGIDIPKTVNDLRTTFHSGVTRPAAWRKQQLEGIAAMMKEREDVFVKALQADMRKPRFEAFGAEVSYLLNDAKHAIKNLDDWMRPEKVSTNIVNLPATSRILREPLGVVLIIGPWNYPLQLVLSPLIGAIAAGNTAVLKPSEVTANAAAALAEWLPKYVDPAAVRVVEGGVEETTQLLKERFDHIFYTGNGHVGRIVMEAAAKHLTPVTLELGGKSPVIIDQDVDLDAAVRRTLWGKFFNAGQTCLAPDYVLVHKSVEAAFLGKCKTMLREFYGDDPKKSPDFTRIVNQRHHKRLMAMLGDGEVVVGGESDEADCYIAPTIVSIKPDSKLMSDEIFGPILPVMPVDSIDAAINFINGRPKALALYVFTKNSAVSDAVLARTSSGGACVNEVVTHFTVTNLPFGGVGESGMGAYHGRASFETFSHRKSVLNKLTMGEPPVRYPPYTATKEKWLRRLL